jgi:hypothetical protein
MSVLGDDAGEMESNGFLESAAGNKKLRPRRSLGGEGGGQSHFFGDDVGFDAEGGFTDLEDKEAKEKTEKTAEDEFESFGNKSLGGTNSSGGQRRVRRTLPHLVYCGNRDVDQSQLVCGYQNSQWTSNGLCSQLLFQ